MTTMTDQAGYVRVGSLAEVKRLGSKVVALGDYPVLLIMEGEQLRAVDNRCPHMGYPLSKGTVCDGMIRCHWHHWRFELGSGGCLTGGPNDLPIFPVELRGDEVWVKPQPTGSGHDERLVRGREILKQGLEQNDSFTIAKSVTELDGLGVRPLEMVQIGLLHAVRFRQAGFGPGATILIALSRLLPLLDEEQRVYALTHGLIHVARGTTGQAPRRPQRPLPGEQQYDLANLKSLFRTLVHEREPEGGERILRTGVMAGLTQAQAAEIVVAGLTDHYFLETGHILDFANKAFEGVELIGWEHADEVLSALVGPMTDAFRHEESSSWSDSVPLLEAAFADLPRAITAGADKNWKGSDALVETLLESDRPGPIVTAISRAIESGAQIEELSLALGRAAVNRVARYPARNEEDWDSVLHVITYINAYDELVRRIGPQKPKAAAETMRGLYHGAIYLYLNHFLNLPRAKHPAAWPRTVVGSPKDLLARLVECGEHQKVDEAGAVAWAYLNAGHPVEPLCAALAQIVLREDASFHTYQMLEAGIAWHRKLQGHPDADLALAATARYLSAQRARRLIESNVTHALKLRRGESPEED